jgi:hypothetical protein
LTLSGRGLAHTSPLSGQSTYLRRHRELHTGEALDKRDLTGDLVIYSANAYLIRDARVEDVPELVRLGWANAESWPSGQILVGEIRGVVAAALAVDENRSWIATVPGASSLLAHMHARAVGIRAYRRTPSLADRIRERTGGRVTVNV